MTSLYSRGSNCPHCPHISASRPGQILSWRVGSPAIIFQSGSGPWVNSTRSEHCGPLGCLAWAWRGALPSSGNSGSPWLASFMLSMRPMSPETPRSWDLHWEVFLLRKNYVCVTDSVQFTTCLISHLSHHTKAPVRLPRSPNVRCYLTVVFVVESSREAVSKDFVHPNASSFCAFDADTQLV